MLVDMYNINLVTASALSQVQSRSRQMERAGHFHRLILAGATYLLATS